MSASWWLNSTPPCLNSRPPEFVFHLTVEQMATPDTTVFTARDDGAAVACGALKRHDSGIGEVKRMYTRSSHRGRKIGAMIVERIEALARSEGLRRLVLKPAIAIPPLGPSMNGRASSAAGRCSTIPIPNGRYFTRRD
jgi:GNAT superfamily N-acetyltransferase